MKLIHSHSSVLKIFNDRGFTLVELMITLAISGIVLGVLGTAYVSQQRSATAQEQVAEMQQNIRAGLDIMEREIRMAGYDPRHTAGTGFLNSAPYFTNANNLSFTMVADTDGIDNNNNGTTDEPNETETINYYLYDAYGDGDLDLGRRTPVSTQAVAENIEAIEFRYLNSANNVTAVLADIRSVQISILARASMPDSSFTDTATYTSASGVIWGPYNDNLRRRLLISTIQCRNMGL